jgi:hypothetical protein
MAISRYVEAEGIFALLPKWRCVNDYHYYLKDALQSYRANAFYPYNHIAMYQLQQKLSPITEMNMATISFWVIFTHKKQHNGEPPNRVEFHKTAHYSFIKINEETDQYLPWFP